MLAFAGLGNPGAIYKLNRHNVGFMAIDYAKKILNIEKVNIRYKAIIMNTIIEDKNVFFIKPLTYMNRSGEALYNFSLAYNINPKDIIVIHDDIYLPYGKIKIKLKGGDGGHNGVASILSFFNTNEIPRIKIGIKCEQNIASSEYSEYVLSDFNDKELEVLDEILDNVYQIIIMITTEGINSSMNKFNKRKQ